jgi:hypothetical protein
MLVHFQRYYVEEERLIIAPVAVAPLPRNLTRPVSVSDLMQPFHRQWWADRVSI